MIEIIKMYHKRTGEIVFQDANGQWWQQEYQDFDLERGLGIEKDWQPVVATKIDPPQDKE